LYRGLVEQGIASSVSGAILPTEQPFLYTISVTATEGTPLAAVEAATLDVTTQVLRGGVTPAEVARAQAQLRARLVFDDDSITNIAHQLGYFATIANVETFTMLPSRIADTTVEQVNEAARLLFATSNRTIGWFEPHSAEV
jgi:predicted Zn-dependent peptidase